MSQPRTSHQSEALSQFQSVYLSVFLSLSLFPSFRECLSVYARVLVVFTV